MKKITRNRIIIFLMLVVIFIICFLCTITSATIFSITNTYRVNTRDELRLGTIRNLNNAMKDFKLAYGHYPNYSTEKKEVIFEKDSITFKEPYISSLFNLVGIGMNPNGFNKIVSHDNCGAITESSWNIVFEVSKDGQSYDLAACLESGKESKNYSTKPINNF